MPQIITTEKIPISLWLDELDEGTMQQALNLANLPFAFHHIAVMPDAHLGYGMPIGGVLATDKVIIPNAVGVDIGCGMSGVKTDLKAVSPSELKTIMKEIRKTVPLGFKHHKRRAPHEDMPEDTGIENNPRLKIIDQEYDNARTQIGTLGGGNHFIEFQTGADGCIWFMVHSGSRNLGFKVAGHYNQRAVSLNKKWKSPVPSSWQLAYLPVDSEEGVCYLAEMNYCVKFAEKNRALICRKIKEALLEHISSEIIFDIPIISTHNFAAREIHYGKNVYVHRKGATSARENEPAIIPGSQGSSSYIVCGKGNPESFCSCSHGAGRKLGRKQARRQLDLEKEKQLLDRKGIIHAIRSNRDLEEATGAYKDITEVIARQQDLVTVTDILTPRAVIKG